MSRRNIFKIIVIINCIFIIIAYILIRRYTTTYSGEELLNLDDKVKSSEVIAKINKDTNVYSDMELKKVIKSIKEGEEVEIIKDRSKNIYLIKSSKLKLKGWVSYEDIDIPESPKTNENKLTKKELEQYVNSKNFESDSKHLVWVDIDRQLTYIFKGSKNNWKLEKSFICATGVNESPTTRGIFKISDRGEWFYSKRLGSGAKYWVRFNDSYLFHSVAMDENGDIIDNVLGQRRSNGCVRLGLEDIKWFYENIEVNTTVFVN